MLRSLCRHQLYNLPQTPASIRHLILAINGLPIFLMPIGHRAPDTSAFRGNKSVSAATRTSGKETLSRNSGTSHMVVAGVCIRMREVVADGGVRKLKSRQSKEEESFRDTMSKAQRSHQPHDQPRSKQNIRNVHRGRH